MEDISLHVLDIVENALTAGAHNITITLIQDEYRDTLILEIRDDGEGMNEVTRRNALNPFFTTKEGKKVGLGLPLLAQSAGEADGAVEIESMPGKGTRVVATFRLGHIDRKPLGNLGETMRCLTATHPDVNFSFEHACNSG